MNLSAIRTLLEHYERQQLADAEEALLREEAPAIVVEGADAAEQLTHVLAARWIQAYLTTTGGTYTQAVRAYAQRIRSSLN
ncbi:hypothetical protein SAMN05421823_10645 [Catalinimonas alkaloidigena]|uniref:Uncharacterized protein n=1 Tax=Catalinimonas alkaloidigena TaxID=1075417 RepID=A0A1G9K4A4_9BACT|nr:hypothetical protein [Catalinimonas alkaloidigena]SDL44529.1 hypothetical protein SAMN05421823_10645 [Catalinimonas alkaloidigena]